MSVTEKDYHHSIVVIDVDKTAGATTALVRTPRPVAFHRVPAVGAAPLDVIEDALRRMEIDDPGEHRRPYLEVAVWLDGAEPELRRRIDGALEGKPLRLTRIVRQTAGQGGALADAVDGGTALDALEPGHVFVRRYIEQYGVEPPDDLKRAFNEVLTSILSPDDDRPGVK
jgi:exonuclease SbcD